MREILLLEDEELAQIHRTSLRILGETGLIVAHRGALGLLHEHGARVDRDQQRAWLPEELVTQALSTVPSSFTLTGSAPEHDVLLADNGRIHGRPSVGPDFVVDPGALSHQPALVKDTEDWIKLVNRLPNVHIVCCPYPRDVPLASRDVLVVERTLELSPKPVAISHYSANALRWSLELIAMLPERDAGCRLLVFVSCNSPLTFTQGQVDILLAAAEHHVPVAINSAPLAGATAPYTMAGVIAQTNAEVLAGLVLAQLAQPGAPMVWSPLPLILDMRSTAVSVGYAEVGLLLAASVQLGKFYRLPSQCLGLATDAVIPDAQASMEKILVTYASLLAHPSLVGGVGSLSASNVASTEQLILDNDALGGLFHALKGIRVDSDSLAWEVIDRVGPGGHFLAEQHTLDHLRYEYQLSHMANRLAPDAWASAGGLDLRARAAQRVRELLAAPVEPAVPEGLAQEMRRVLRHAQAEISGETAAG